MDFKQNENCIWLEDESGKKIAWVEFPRINEITVDIIHTVVDESLQGQGIAGKLMEELAHKLSEENLKAKLTCSYAVKWFLKHHEYNNLVVD